MSLRKPYGPFAITDSEINSLENLEEYLREAKMFETQQKLDKRREVLDQLQILSRLCIRDVCIMEKRMPPKIADTVGGRLYTFGSYHLGVVSEDTAIDAICLAPLHISREHFMFNFNQLLEKQEQITELKLVDDKCLKMKFDGIEINLFFARLPLDKVDKNFDLQDVIILQHLDAKCFKYFNACRVTDSILKSVPDVQTFRLALRAIKLWAKRHDIYCHDIGYFGGVTWSILVAKICQLFPNDTAVALIEKFFHVFANWTWPAPVVSKISFDNSYGLKVWDPRIHVQDYFDMMPIITPSYPHSNSSWTLTRSTRNVILDELTMGQSVSNDIARGEASWGHLFQPNNFFAKYRSFVLVIVKAQHNQRHEGWFNVVASNLRHFVLILERNPLLQTIHINPNSFTCCHEYYRDKHHISWIVGLNFKISYFTRRDLEDDFKKFEERVLRLAVESQTFEEGMQVNFHGVSRSRLPMYINRDVLDSHISEVDYA